MIDYTCSKYLGTQDSENRKCNAMGTSLAVQWLRLCTYTTESPGSNPSQVTKIPRVVKKSAEKRKENVTMCFLGTKGKENGYGVSVCKTKTFWILSA